jgi:regulator of replication initiation timing
MNKDDRIRELQAEVERLQREISHLQIEVTNLRGLKPEIPPMPGEDWPRELPRYMLRWNGHDQPASAPHKDGYWTPWYLANLLYAELERERKATKTACENWGEMEQERDQLRARLGHCQRFLASGILYTYDELLRHDADVIDRACSELELRAKEDGDYYTIDPIQMRDYANQLRQQAKEAQP